MADETTAAPASAGACPRCGKTGPGRHKVTDDPTEQLYCFGSSHYPPTPELDKQSKIIESGKNTTIADFLDWCSEQGYHLGRYDENGTLWEVHGSPNVLLAGFFGIDLAKVDSERLALLEHIRALS